VAFGIDPMMRTLLAKLRGLVFGRPAVIGPPEGLGVQTLNLAERATHRSPTLTGPSERRPSMNAAYEKLIQHLDEHGVNYLTRGDNQSICADFRGEVGTYRIIAAIDSDDDLFQVFGFAPVRAPEGSRPAVAETVARANYGLKVGKFEMDLDDGELRFQVAQILTDDNLEDEVIRRLIGTTMAMLDMYLPAVLSVIYGNELPKDAIRFVEAGRCGPGEADSDERGADD
jgi:hypothetical protein